MESINNKLEEIYIYINLFLNVVCNANVFDKFIQFFVYSLAIQKKILCHCHVESNTRLQNFNKYNNVIG